MHEEKTKQNYFSVLLNTFLGESTGCGLCSELRKLISNYFYFIVCATDTSPETFYNGLAKGVDDYLRLPIDHQEVSSRIIVARRLLGLMRKYEDQRHELESASERLEFTNSNLIAASNRFAELFNGLPMAAFTFDQSGVLHEWNREAESLLGLKAHEVFQVPVWKVLQRAKCGWSEAETLALFETEENHKFDWEYLTKDGRTICLACNLMFLRDIRGSVTGIVAANLDVTERRSAEEKINKIATELETKRKQLIVANKRLELQAKTDGLTGLLNHRSFQNELSHCLESALQSGSHLSLTMLDLDHFKSLNDQYGHVEGDAALRSVATVLKMCQGAVACRYGGEEFALIWDGLGPDEALSRSEDIRKAIEGLPSTSRPITASFGVSTMSDHAQTTKQLICLADDALYAAKRSGRNRVVFSDDVTEENRDRRRRVA